MAKFDFPEQAQHLIREHPYHPRHLRSILPTASSTQNQWNADNADLADLRRFLPTNIASAPKSDYVDISLLSKLHELVNQTYTLDHSSRLSLCGEILLSGAGSSI